MQLDYIVQFGLLGSVNKGLALVYPDVILTL